MLKILQLAKLLRIQDRISSNNKNKEFKQEIDQAIEAMMSKSLKILKELEERNSITVSPIVKEWLLCYRGERDVEDQDVVDLAMILSEILNHKGISSFIRPLGKGLVLVRTEEESILAISKDIKLVQDKADFCLILSNTSSILRDRNRQIYGEQNIKELVNAIVIKYLPSDLNRVLKLFLGKELIMIGKLPTRKFVVGVKGHTRIFFYEVDPEDKCLPIEAPYSFKNENMAKVHINTRIKLDKLRILETSLSDSYPH